MATSVTWPRTPTRRPSRRSVRHRWTRRRSAAGTRSRFSSSHWTGTPPTTAGRRWSAGGARPATPASPAPTPIRRSRWPRHIDQIFHGWIGDVRIVNRPLRVDQFMTGRW